MNKELQKTFVGFGMGGVAPPIGASPDWEEAKAQMVPVAAGLGGLLTAVAAGRPTFKDTRRDITIKGVDGNDIPLQIYQGTSKTCYYQTHGGGMAFLSSRDSYYAGINNKMSGQHGMTIVSVDFRNYLNHPDPDVEVAQFPAGLNDCYSGLEWLHEHKDLLGCETVVNFGESGGGNLCLALSLKTVKEGRTDLLDGSYCMCPEASNDMVAAARFPSITENAGYFLDFFDQGTQIFADLYTADPADRTNPLAWPIHAGPEDMKGMKPVFIWNNELDPLRDVGMEMYRNLQNAGVQSEATIYAGTTHVGEGWLAGMYLETWANSMKSFAAGLRGKILVEADKPDAEVEVKAT